MERTFPFESKSSPGTTYSASVADDGKLRCDCRGFFTKKNDKPRECTHTKQIVVKLYATTEVRGDYLHIISEGPTAPAPRALEVAAVTVAASDGISAPPPPMLASAVEESIEGETFDARFSSGGRYAMEEKLDGHRMQIVVTGGEGQRVVTAFARPRAGTGKSNVRALPQHIVNVLAGFPVGIYDGELVASAGKSSDVIALGSVLSYVLFDLIEHDGHSWTREPYSFRRAGLRQIADALLDASDPAVRLVDSVRPSWAALSAIWDRGGEGAIVKELQSNYAPGVRSLSWLKFKKKAAAVLTITGFAHGKSGPFSVIALRDDEGNETTVKTRNVSMLRDIAAAPQSFVGRRVVISYQERTAAGSYRHGMFDHFLDQPALTAQGAS